ncbi:hypothetical protein [Paenibacillus cremeus]|uniref:hypothetical protein n=1 Tax=Paenibacillus cremeus TaxID=2163881 RepID=UPI001644AB3F|nr:hypothetical protein [Paenibacillus cremeus]
MENNTTNEIFVFNNEGINNVKQDATGEQVTSAVSDVEQEQTSQNAPSALAEETESS